MSRAAARAFVEERALARQPVATDDPRRPEVKIATVRPTCAQQAKYPRIWRFWLKRASCCMHTHCYREPWHEPRPKRRRLLRESEPIVVDGVVLLPVLPGQRIVGIAEHWPSQSLFATCMTLCARSASRLLCRLARACLAVHRSLLRTRPQVVSIRLCSLPTPVIRPHAASSGLKRTRHLS